ncbi:MAG: ATP-dependent helicase [Anaerolineales bacterium]|nr:ATP-dependent helicase [Anaerolineales bacterium]
MTNFIPRPAQQAVLEYPGGSMGISAVPGSGKTWTLSALAAQIILEDLLTENQEILIVTLTNSAVDHFATRIEGFLRDQDRRPLLPYYRVRTLHGLAHDIVRERPELVGLDSNFQIIDEREANAIRDDVANTWLRANPNILDDYFNPELDESRRDWVRRDQLPNLVKGIAMSFIRTAKDMQLTPEALRLQLENLPLPLPLAEMGLWMFTEYQRSLAYRGAVDFDDLIRLALGALHSDDDLLTRLREMWPFILEDEAQDSSRLQEEILRLLAGATGNWVRVGDPNQAIYESFTTADPKYLREFMAQADFPRELPNSGRSTQSVIDLANYLIDWTQSEHPVLEVRNALDIPYIEPTPGGDPQPNPPDAPEAIHLVDTKFSPDGEIQAVADSVERWLKDHPDETVAVLAPRNTRGFALNDELRRRKIETVDGLLRSSSSTRFTAGALGNILQYLADPGSARKLATVYRVWRRADRADSDLWEQVEATAKILKGCHHVEDFLQPGPERDWLDDLQEAEILPGELDQLEEFRRVLQYWLKTIELPIDQMILTLSQELFTRPNDLAISHKLAVLLRRVRNLHPEWHLPELTGELAVIAKNERRFLGFSEDDSGFDPDKHKGKVVIATIHKAKGLEWDRVYLMSVNNYDFPSGMEYDNYIPEKWFIRDSLNLEAETLAQLEAAFSRDVYEWYAEGTPTYEARMEYVRERLRLLYVGITRARKELVITWNTGRKGNLQPAIPLVALQSFWENKD